MTSSQAVRLGIVTLIWGTTWTVIRWQIADAPASWSVAYRFWIAGAAMAALCLATGRSMRLDARGHGFAVILGLFQFVMNFNFVYAAEQYVTSGLVAVVFALLVVPNAALAWAFYGQRVSARFMAGSAIGIAGVALLFRQEFMTADSFAGLAGYGLALTCLAVLSASVANVMQLSGRARAAPAYGLLAVSMLYGAAINTAVAWAIDGRPPLPASALYWGGTVYLGLVASAAAFTLYYALIREIGPAKAAYSSLVVPFVAMTLSTVLEGYQWTLYAAAGAALAFAGIVLALVRPAPVAVAA